MPSTHPLRRALLTGLAALALAAAACTAADGDTDTTAGVVQDDTDDLVIVATTSILGDVVGHLLEEDGTVEVLMPPGTDPHVYEPSARDVAHLRDADLVVANGLQLEEGLLGPLEAAEEEGVRVLEVAPRLDPIAFDWDGPHDHGHDDGHGHDEDDHGHDDGHGHDEDDHGHDDGHGHDDDHGHDEDDHGHDDGHGHDEDDHGHDDGHDHGPEDPHVWHDPVRMADGVLLIAEELAEVSEVVDADEWQRRAQAYADELLEVHDEVEAMLATVPDEHRKLITNHDAFGYLAARYDFEVLGTVIPGSSTDVETNPRAFAELIEALGEAGIPAVFSENTESADLIEQLAREAYDRGDLEVGVVSLYSDALGEPGSPGETYLGLLRENAQRIAAALG